MIEGVIITPLKTVNATGGDVLHVVKVGDNGFSSFGEAYFSTIESGAIKAWKRHREMTLNLVVPVGEIKFIIFDDRNQDKKLFMEVFLSRSNYCRLTVPPMVWMGFQGMGGKSSILLNVASVPHNPEESDRKEVGEIEFNWSGK